VGGIDDFATAHDIALKMLEGRTVTLTIRNLDGGTTELGPLASDGAACDLARRYPIALAWLVERMSQELLRRATEAWKRSEASVPASPAEDSGGADSALVKAHFGDSLLFSAYEFMAQLHSRPRSWDELFEFLRYCKTKNALRDMAMAMSRAEGRHG
jgi:hypothetical protein